jgi:hypothetical protein
MHGGVFFFGVMEFWSIGDFRFLIEDFKEAQGRRFKAQGLNFEFRIANLKTK